MTDHLFARFTDDEERHVTAILDRSAAWCRDHGFAYTSDNRLNQRMDLAACHKSCPLDLRKLAESDDLTFDHDTRGIEQNINRATGLLDNCFLPRCASNDEAGSDMPLCPECGLVTDAEGQICEECDAA